MPVYTDAQGLGTGDLTIVLVVATLAGVLVAMPVGVAADRIGRRPVLLVGIGIACLASIAALVLDGTSLVAVAAVAFVFTLGAGPLYSLGSGQTNDYVPAREFVAASGGLLCAWAVGASIGAAVGAQAMVMAGPRGLFLYEIAILMALGAFTVYRMARRPGRPNPVPRHEP